MCAVRAMTGQTPPIPGRLPVDSRGSGQGARLRREPPLPSKDRDGHTAGRGLPRTEASCQPLLSEQACGRQDRQVAGGQGAALASDSPKREAGGPFLQGFPRTPWCEGALSSNASAHPYLQLHLLHPGHLAGLLSGGFHQPPEFLSLRKLLAFMGLNTPGSDLENRAQHYLERFSYLELVELDDEDEEDWGGRAGDRVGHTDPASVQLGRENRVGSHPIPMGCSLGRPPRALALTHERWEECP